MKKFVRLRKPPILPPTSRVSRRYLTMVGERGITLSGGQKQRTAIARAIIRNPRILILDDALSSVDTHTEDKILNHLREIMQDRTTILSRIACPLYAMQTRSPCCTPAGS